MGPETQPEAVGDSRHYWARPESQLDLSKVKPHTCMVNIEQRGNYIHCFDGSHGMRIPAGKMLVRDAAGNWDLQDLVIQSSPKLPKWAKLPKE